MHFKLSTSVRAILRTDCGTENGDMAAIQTIFWVAVTVYGTSISNQRIEAWWLYFRGGRIGFLIGVFKESHWILDTSDLHNRLHHLILPPCIHARICSMNWTLSELAGIPTLFADNLPLLDPLVASRTSFTFCPPAMAHQTMGKLSHIGKWQDVMNGQKHHLPELVMPSMMSTSTASVNSCT